MVNTPTNRQLELQRGGGTLLYEAVAVASRDTMRPLQGRKALIILSDGVDVGSEVSLSTAIEEAQRSDTLIYSIVFSDATYYGGFGIGEAGGRAVLERMSRETGGTCFDVSKRLSLDDVFAAIQDELRSQYSIGLRQRPAGAHQRVPQAPAQGEDQGARGAIADALLGATVISANRSR